jgi:hypothetical protein
MPDISSCEALLAAYMDSLREGFNASDAEGECLVVTPFSRPDGGMVEVEIKALPDGQLQLSDLGESIGYLYVNGLTVNRATLDEVRRVIRQHGVHLDNAYELVVHATSEASAGERLNELIQAALRVTDMIQRRRPYQRIRFEDVVETYLVGQRAVYDSDFQVQGETSPHRIRFHVNSGRKLLIQPLSATNETIAFSWAERWAYRFDDIRRRDPAWKPFAVLDDRGDRAGVWTSRVVLPLRRDASIVMWADPSPLAEALASSTAR